MANDGQIECSGRFNRNVPSVGGQSLAQRDHFGEEHRLAAGKHHMVDHVVAARRGLGELVYPLDDLLDRKIHSLGLPGSVGRVAVDAPQVATASAHEDARRAGQSAFALQGSENLGNPHSMKKPFQSGERKRRSRKRFFGFQLSTFRLSIPDTARDLSYRPPQSPSVAEDKRRSGRRRCPARWGRSRCVLGRSRHPTRYHDE